MGSDSAPDALGRGATRESLRPARLVSKFYFVYYAAAAALVPNLPLIFEDIGLSGSEIGLLLALPPAISVIVAPAAAVVADLTGRGRVILGAGVSLAGVSAIGLGAVSAFVAALGVMLIFAVSIAPVVPFVDAAAVSVAASRGSYGRLRLWGGVGWGLAAPVVGWGVDRVGLGLAPTVFAIGMVALLVLVRRVPVSVGSPGRLSEVRRALRASKGWLPLLSGGFVIGAAGGTIGFLFVLLRYMGASSLTMGIALTIATVSELVGFVVSPRVIRRIGVSGTMLLGCVAAGIRLLIYGTASSVELVLAAQLLHGVTFALPWAAGVIWASRLSPRGLETTGQGIFSAVSLGLGPTVGVIIAGILVDVGSAGSMMGQMGVILLALSAAIAIPMLRSVSR